MFKSLYSKLTLAFALLAFLTAALVAVFIRLNSEDELSRLIVDQQRSSLKQALQEYYSENGSLDLNEESWRQLQARTFVRPEDQLTDRPPREDSPPVFVERVNLLGLADAKGKVIIPVDPNYPAGSQLTYRTLVAGDPLLVDGVQVGTILTAAQPLRFNPQEARFLNRTNQALIFASLGALLVAVVLGVFIARTLTDPLHALTRAAQDITRGQIGEEVRVSSNDEIGELASAFNRMSQEVVRVNQMRRRMTADIAHDLRTPLTVISGYVESMRDGVLKPTPQRFELMYTEIERLQNLVGDLQMLSLADSGELSLNPQRFSPRILLDRAAELFRHKADQQNVTIKVRAGANLPDILVDEARMMQVLDNLISNALRYSPPGSDITLCTRASGDRLEICVQDTGEGIAAEELPYIFHRFHRADKSRHSETGEVGLGLAIVKALVEAHGGSVSAKSTPGEGTTIHLIFPSNEQSG